MKYKLETKRFKARTIQYPYTGWDLVETETRIVDEQFYKNTIDPMALEFLEV